MKEDIHAYWGEPSAIKKLLEFRSIEPSHLSIFGDFKQTVSDGAALFDAINNGSIRWKKSTKFIEYLFVSNGYEIKFICIRKTYYFADYKKS